MNKKMKAVLAVALLSGATMANAALPAEAQAAIDGISAFATDILAAVWPIVATVVLGFVGMKLFKRGANKV